MDKKLKKKFKGWTPSERLDWITESIAGIESELSMMKEYLRNLNKELRKINRRFINDKR